MENPVITITVIVFSIDIIRLCPSWFLFFLEFHHLWTPFFSPPGEVEAELLQTYSRIDPYDTLILCVRVAVLTAVTLTVPIVLFPVSTICDLPLIHWFTVSSYYLHMQSLYAYSKRDSHAC